MAAQGQAETGESPNVPDDGQEHDLVDGREMWSQHNCICSCMEEEEESLRISIGVFWPASLETFLQGVQEKLSGRLWKRSTGRQTGTTTQYGNRCQNRSAPTVSYKESRDLETRIAHCPEPVNPGAVLS